MESVTKVKRMIKEGIVNNKVTKLANGYSLYGGVLELIKYTNCIDVIKKIMQVNEEKEFYKFDSYIWTYKFVCKNDVWIRCRDSVGDVKYFERIIDSDYNFSEGIVTGKQIGRAHV